MMHCRRSLAWFLACVPALAAHSVRADPSSAEISSARQAFEKAVSLESEQRWAEAELKLRAAVAVKDTPGLRFHLGRCEAEQGKLVEAALEYERADQLLRQGAIAPDAQRLLPAASLALKRRTPRVTVELAPDLSAVSAWLDGKGYALSELALGLPFNPGRHELRVSAAGRPSFERSLLLEEGDAVTIRAEFSASAPPVGAPGPGAISGAEPGPAPDTRSQARPSSAKLYVVLGESVLIVVGLALGIGYKLAASSASDRVDRAQGQIDLAPRGGSGACVNPDAPLAGACYDLTSAIDDHERAARISNVGFFAAGAGAVALATTWLVWPAAPQKTSGPALEPLFTLGQVGLQGRF